MCINKDLKLAISRPTKSYIQKTSLFFNYRIKAYKSLIHQLFPETSKDSTTPSITMLDNTPQFARKEENIQVMSTEINEKNLFPLDISTNRGIINVFTSQLATTEQAHDLLNCHSIGEITISQTLSFVILAQALQ